MLANPTIASQITEKDRALLAYLHDIRLELHEHDQGFTLTFDFETNSYFKNATLTKKYHMSNTNVIDKCEGCTIDWTQGSDPTKTKKKKNQKKGGKKTKVTVTVKCDSFFNFFETIDADEKDEEKPNKDDEDEDDPANEIGERMDADFDCGVAFKDDLIPLALEYYLGVIEQEDEPDYGDEDGSDDDQPPAKKPAKKAKKEDTDDSDKKGGAGADGEVKPECKQQ